jgi:predicted enzyme related to lactoylglutathione lyase
MSRHHAVDYFEIPVTELAGAKAFFAAAFGWSYQDYGPDYAEIHGAGLTGGLRLVAEEPPRGGTLVILYSDDLAQSELAVTAAGGTIIARHDFPGGRRFHFVAPGGCELAVWTKV